MFAEGQRPGGVVWVGVWDESLPRMEDNLLTVEGGSGCLKELSIPAALLTEERLKQSVLCTSNTHTHTHNR